MSGLSPEAARSAGVNPKRMVLITLFMSGAIAGMIGLPYLLADPNFLKYGDAFPTTIGFTGLGLALLGRNNPIGIAAAAIVWATIERATQRLGPIGIPPEIGRILQGAFLLTAVIAYEVINRRERGGRRQGRRGGHGPAQTRRRGITTAAARQPDRGSTGMTIVADSPAPSTAPTARTSGWRSSRWLPLAAVVAAFAILSTTRILSDTDDLTSSGTFGVALRTAAPIGLAGLAGLVAERSGTINIGLDGMMVLGTIFAGWWGWEYGPWAALLGGIIGGMIGGLVMSVATTTFGVNHIVAGVAINLIAPGAARFMAGELFVDTQGGAITTSPGNKGAIGAFTVPFLSGGDLFGWTSPDILGWIEDHGWFLVADLAAVVKGATTAVTWDVVLTIVVFFGVAYLLWRTPIGLRLRAAGERPAAADSLGVSVHRMRYLGMGLSGALAGMGGAVLVLFSNRYQEGQAGARGFLGLATMIFGNWMPGGTALGAGLFGYAQGITLRTNPADLVSALILAAAISLLVLVVWMAFGKNWRSMGFIAVFTAITFWAFFAASQPNNQLVFITPYVVTLIAVSVGAQRLRPPAEEGIPWFKGMQ